MSFQPHPIQVQALRIARRFQRGFRPTKLAGKPVTPASNFSIKFEAVPSFVLSAEIGLLPGQDDLIDELCQRGHLRKRHGYPECMRPPMEYVTEDGTKVCVHDRDWGEISVWPPNATHVRRHLGRFSGRLTLRVPLPAGADASPSKPTGNAPKVKRRAGSAARGISYELLPEGFKLLDQHEQGDGLGGSKQKPKRPAWDRLTLHRSSDGSDHTALLDGKNIRIRGDAAFNMLDVLQRKKGERVKAAVLQIEINQRPDRVLKQLDRRLQRIIDQPKKGGVGYAML